MNATIASPWVLVTGDFTPLGGMDVANHGLAKFLARQGSVHLVAHRVWPDLLELPNCHWHPARRPAGKHLLGAWFLNRVGRRIAQKLTQEHPEAKVVVNGSNCDWPGINWVHYVHAAYPATPAEGVSRWRVWKTHWQHRQAVRAEAQNLRQARLILCNSHRTAQDVRHATGVPQDRLHVIYYGTDPQRFPLISPDERRQARAKLGWPIQQPVVVFVGALGDRRKGFDRLYQAWKLACQSPGWSARLVVIGRGATIPLWQQQAQDDGLAEQIEFLGFRDDVPECLAAADLMVHPARYEAYGLGVHEALCRGLPVLVSSSAGVAERYPPELTDWLIPNTDAPEPWAESLVHWHQAADTWKERVRPLADQLRQRTWDDMAQDISEVVAS